MSKMILRSIIVLALLAVSVCAAFAQQPSAKATFAFDELIALPRTSCNQTTCPAESAWTPILTQQIKMAQWKDLFIDASLQCGIVTDTTVKSLNGSTDTSEARATVRVKVEVQDLDGNHVAWAQPDAGSDATGAEGVDGVVFCDRVQTLKAKFSGLSCTVNLVPGTPGYGTVTCADPEELELILKTLNANSFNFVASDLAQGVYKIVVKAKTSASVTTATVGGAADELGNANAFIGAGSVAIEAVRMIKNEQVEF